MANERRLISADEIEKLFYAQIEDGATDLMDAFDDALQDCQSVDAVEVCCCKNCYWNDRAGRCMNPKCDKSWYGCLVPDDHFCSYGEKREVE